MNERIKRFIKKMTVSQSLIYDKYHIKYLTGYEFDVGERFIALLIQKKKDPILFINKLFPKPNTIHSVVFEDHENPLETLELYLTDDPIGIDGSFPSRFILPLVHKAYPLMDISATLYSLRAEKDAHELKKMKKASKLNDAIMHTIQKHLKIGISEKELADKIQTLQSSAPLEGPSFSPIVLFSENIADPHGTPGHRQLRQNDVVLIDMGGIYQSYCSDMTRCFFIGDNPELENLYQIVLEANKKAIESIRLGITLGDVDRVARSVIEKYGYGKYFVHRTGHGIGLETHESLDVAQNSKQVIQNGMCFSIEPGIYIPNVGGIRIEDLVCIENDEVKILNHFPKEIHKVKIK